MSTAGKRRAISRRRFLQTGSLAVVAGAGMRSYRAWGSEPAMPAPLAEFGYGDVSIASEPHESQLMNTHDVLMALSEDSLLKPFRQMSGMPAPGEDLGGWYQLQSRLRLSQRTSIRASRRAALSGNGCRRWRAPTPSPAKRRRARRCCGSTAFMPRPFQPDFYKKNRFPAYTYDKLLLGLLDSHTYVKDPQALAILEQTTNTALPHLAGTRHRTRPSMAHG